jgi:hypothetical protein
MSIGPLVNLASGYIESLFANSGAGTSSATKAATVTTGTQDSNSLSPFAQVLSSLQQIQQTNPSQYQQVTNQISANLHAAAQTASANGETGLASELTKLSGDFSSASGSGQIPNIQDLAQAIGGGHHHFHHRPVETAASDSTSSNSGSTASSSLDQLLQALGSSQSGTQASNSLAPLNIIESTLSAAGVQGN